MINTITGKIHSIETCGTVDGPGIRYVLFLQGCSLRCQYCHNPDTWALQGGTEMTVAELIKDIKKYASYMKYSGGGITVTGGEPLLQADFLAALFERCRKEGIHTAVDTSGHMPIAAVEDVLQYTDLLLLDMKSYREASFQNVTGVSIDHTKTLFETLRTKQFPNALGEMRLLPLWVRFVLVPGLTDDWEEIEEMGAYLQKFTNIERIEVLPFHKLGEYKWKALGHTYALNDTPAPDYAMIAKAKALLNAK